MSSRARTAVGVLALAGLAVLVYLPVFNAGFIWDDGVYVKDLAALKSPGGLGRIWTDFAATPQYYPVVFTSFWIEYRLWGLNPAGYHTVNILLHAACAALLWILLRRLGVRGAWLIAAVFACHPLNVESVAWITERKNVLSMLFALLAAMAYLRKIGTHPIFSRSWAGRAGVVMEKMGCVPIFLFALALLSKTAVCGLPLALLAIVWWKRGRLGWRDLAAVTPMLLLAACGAVLTAWIESSFYGDARPPVGAALGLADRVIVAGRALWFYVGKVLCPAPLTAVYTRWEVSAGTWWQWLFPLSAMATVAGLAIARRRIGRGPLAAAMVFIVMLAPALGFFQIAYHTIYSYVADHFAYFAVPAAVALAVEAGAKLLDRAGPRSRPIGIVASTAVLIALSALAWRHANVFKDNLTLWQDAAAKNPTCMIAHDQLGMRWVQAGQMSKAVEEFSKVVELAPRFAEGYANRGGVYLQCGRFQQALADFDAAVALDGQFASAWCSRGSANCGLGRHEQADADFTKAIELDPTMAAAWSNRAICRFHQRRYAEAMADVRKFQQLGGQAPPEFIQALDGAIRSRVNPPASEKPGCPASAEAPAAPRQAAGS